MVGKKMRYTYPKDLYEVKENNGEIAIYKTSQDILERFVKNNAIQEYRMLKVLVIPSK